MLSDALHTHSLVSLLTRIHLVLASRGLASLQLIHIPSTNSQAALVLIHALSEVADLCLASSALILSACLLVLLCEFGRGWLLLSGSGGAAREETADGMADGRSYSDTAMIM